MKRITTLSLLILFIAAFFNIPGAIAQDRWAICGIFNEEQATIVFGNPGFSQDVDFGYFDDTPIGNTPRLHAIWTDTYRYGIYKPVHTRFTGYGFKSIYNNDNYDNIPHPSGRMESSAQSTKLVKVGDTLLAVYVCIDNNYSYLVYSCMKLTDQNNLFQYWITDSTLVSLEMYYGQRVTQGQDDDGLYENEPYLCEGPNNTAYLAFTKLIGKKRQVCISQFELNTYPHVGGSWHPVQGAPDVATNYSIVSDQTVENFSARVEKNLIKETPVVCFETIPKYGQNEILCTKLMLYPDVQVSGWYRLNGINAGYESISRTPDSASHTPFFKPKQGYLETYIFLWSETYKGGSTTGIAYIRWSGGAFYDIKNQFDKFSFIRNPGSTSATNPSFMLDSQGGPLIVWEEDDTETFQKRSFVMFWDSQTQKLINPVNPFDQNPLKLRVETNIQYLEIYGCKIAPSKTTSGYDYDSPVIMGVARKGRDSHIFYMKFHKDPTTFQKNPITMKVSNDSGSGETDGWLTFTPYKRYTFRFDVDKSSPLVPPNSWLFVRFNTILKFTSCSQLQNQNNPITFQWSDDQRNNLPPTNWHYTHPAQFDSIRWMRIKIDNAWDSFFIEFIIPQADSTLPELYPAFEPPFYYTKAFILVDQSSYNIPPLLTPPVFNETSPPEYPSYAFGCNVPFSYNFFIDPDTLYIDQDSSKSTTCFITTTYYSVGYVIEYKLSVPNAFLYEGLSITFNPISDTFLKMGQLKSAMTVYASKNAKQGWQTIRVQCNLVIKNRQDPTIEWSISTMTSDVEVKILKPELVGDKQTKSSMAIPGELVTYYIKVRNIGDGTAYNIEVIDTLPYELKYVSSLPSGTTTGNKIIWHFDSLGAGLAINIQLICRLRNDLGLRPGDLVINTCNIASTTQQLKSNVAVMVQPSQPGCEMPQIELYIKGIGRGNQVVAGKEMQCQLRIKSGCGPFEASIFWGDDKGADRFVVGESGIRDILHTFIDAGDYIIMTTVRDDYGKTVNVYKHIRVVSQ